MIKKSIRFVSTCIIGVLVFVVMSVNSSHALSTIEEGCLDCHYRGSSIVPDTRQFENSTSWHNLHRSFSCSDCHPSGAGSTPIAVASCRGCHTTTCAWHDFHENNVGPTCYDCHSECYTPVPVCGNSIIDAGEQCDDGNTAGGDCCSATCQFERAGSPCPDGLYCNGEETCDNRGSCQAGTPVNCSDGVACTDDACDEGTRSCFSTPNDNHCTDDGLFCNGNEFCDPLNNCSSTGDPCPNGNTCNETTDSCDLLPECGDGVLNPGEDCDDGNVADGDCCSALCEFEPAGSSCADNQYCNGDETCDGSGTCQPGEPVDCGDGNDCTADSCDEINDSCVNEPDNGLCDDGNFCNGEETCDLISGCQFGTPVDCSDGITCTDDACDERTGRCLHTPNDNNCTDDGLFCNGNEVCDSQNDCSSTGDPCRNGTTCNETTASCDIQPECGDGILDPGEDCDDGNVADGDCCSAFCEFEPAGSVCADDQYCNGEETCDGNGTCQAGTPLDCNDSIPCTVDSCDEVNQRCVNTPNDNNCSDDGLFCTGQEICDPVNGCVSTGNPCPAEQICDEESNQCARTPECTFDDECDDGMFCNGVEFCTADGMCQSGTAPCSIEETCDEGNDSCVAVEMDLDIVALRTTKWVRLKRVKDVEIKLIVENGGSVDTAMKRANVTGRQDGETVYSETIPVNDPVGRGRTTWTFPPYKPVEEGAIVWTATIEDEDPDNDEKSVRTIVLP